MLFFVKTVLLVMPVFFIDSLYIKVTCKYKLVTFLFFLLFVIVILLLFRKDPIQFNSIQFKSKSDETEGIHTNDKC